MQSRKVAMATALVLSVVLLPMKAPAQASGASGPGDPAAERSHASGIAIVGKDPIQFRAANEDQAMAFDAALNLALANRNDMGYPWIDAATNQLAMSTVSDRGSATARQAGATLRTVGPAPRVKAAQASIAKLDELADDVTRLAGNGVPHANLIWMTEPDQRNNRVIITVSELNDQLMSALASRYGTKLIAVRVREGGPLSAANRDADAPAYWGGAYFTTSTGKACTTGLAWTDTKSAMLTAAHCISTGGKVSYPGAANVGTVASGSEENWSDTKGTQYYTGQSVYRGDIALIRYTSAASAGTIYCGAVHSSTSCDVKSMSSRASQFGDAACVNGVVSAEWCGMVTATRGNAWYLVNGIDVWARHVNQAEAAGNHCPTHGDSGAPVFRKVTGGVSAVGILSGSAPLVAECAVYFTDVQDAWLALPGNLKIR